MKKVKFGILVGVLILAFPFLFIAGITHTSAEPNKAEPAIEATNSRSDARTDDFVYNSRPVNSPKQ